MCLASIKLLSKERLKHILMDFFQLGLCTTTVFNYVSTGCPVGSAVRLKNEIAFDFRITEYFGNIFTTAT